MERVGERAFEEPVDAGGSRVRERWMEKKKKKKQQKKTHKRSSGCGWEVGGGRGR